MKKKTSQQNHDLLSYYIPWMLVFLLINSIIIVRIVVFWDMKPYSMTDRYQHSEEHATSIFKEKNSLFFFTLKIEVAGSSETIIPIYQSTEYHIPGFSNLILNNMRTSSISESVSSINFLRFIFDIEITGNSLM